MSSERFAWTLGSFLVGCLFIMLWQLIADARLISPVYLASPDHAWKALVAGMQTGALLVALLGTVKNMLYRLVPGIACRCRTRRVRGHLPPRTRLSRANA